MAIETNLNRKVFTASNGQTAFAFGEILYFKDSHLKVYVNGSLKSLGSDYSANPATNTPNGTAGGEITFVDPMTGGEQVIIERSVPLVQEVDYQENGKFPANTHEMALDWLTMIAQQHDLSLARSLRQPIDDTSNILAIPSAALRKNGYLTFDGNGDPTIASLAQSLSQTAIVSGIWTPVVDAVTHGDLSVAYSVQQGQWIKIGQFVFLSAKLIFNPTYTTASGNLKITGAPYSMTGSSFPVGSCAITAKNIGARTAYTSTMDVTGAITLYYEATDGASGQQRGTVQLSYFTSGQAGQEVYLSLAFIAP